MSSTRPSSDSSEVLQALIEGELSPDQFALVQERLKTEPALLREYLEIVRTHHLLEERTWEEAEQDAPKVVPMPQAGPSRWLVVAGAMAAAFMLLFVWMGPTTEVPSTVSVQQPDFQFAAHALFDAELPEDRDSGRIQEGDVVALREGYVSVRLVSGAEAVIESPSSFAIEGPNRLRLDRGRATFRVPDAATGFTVKLPWLEVVDLGTVFSTGADEEANRVYVEQGTVEVHHPELLGHPQLLVEGETLTCLRNQEIEMESDTSLVHLREQAETSVLFHDLLSYVPDQRFSERQPMNGSWEVVEGDPWVRDGKMDTEGADTMVYGHFSEAIHGGAGVMLVYLRARAPENLFHSKGWAGISVFDGEHESFFFGDKSNDSYSWNFIPYGRDGEPGMKTVPNHDLQIQGGEESFTIRYHQETGDVEIFRGWGVSGAPVLEVTMDPGLRFDRIRIANSGGGDFSFEEVQVSLLR